ncbi:hypothetical protein GCM10009672_24880 [Nesterenkonia lutea]
MIYGTEVAGWCRASPSHKVARNNIGAEVPRFPGLIHVDPLWHPHASHDPRLDGHDAWMETLR